MAARDRRGGASTSQAGKFTDVESLEQHNDESLNSLGDKVGLLKKLTSNIKQEVNSQNNSLDGLGDAFGGAQIGLAAASAKFKKVFEDPKRNRTFMIAGISVVILLGLYLLLTKK